jgi:hypothetical protein
VTTTAADAPTTLALSQSDRLRLKIGLALPELRAALHGITSHPRVADLYPEYLVTLHGMLRATGPMMQAALRRARALAATDPVAAMLATYLAKHIPEEKNHDLWLLQDLEVLGWDRADVLRRPPSPTVAALIGAQYYWIEHYHPVVALGYLEVAEGYPSTAEWVDALIAATGYSRRAFRCITRHVGLDLHHRDDLHALLDGLPLTTDQIATIGVNALQSVHLAARALREVVENADTGALGTAERSADRA